MAHYLLAQVEETKNGLFRVVAKEIREFLEHTNLGTEMQKMLTTVQFEINTTIRFKPNDGSSEPAEGDAPKMPKPEVKSNVQVKRPDERASAASGAVAESNSRESETCRSPSRSRARSTAGAPSAASSSITASCR